MEKEQHNDRNEETIEVGPIEKNGEKMMKSVEDGNMVAILSGNEIMYLYIHEGQYHCLIHPIASDEGRHKAWDVSESNRAMFKNLDSAAEQLFEIKLNGITDYMGVMVSSEQGIVNYLQTMGHSFGEKIDFSGARYADPSTGDGIPQ